MNQLKYYFFVGIHLGQWLHIASVDDAKGEFMGERGFPHSREGLSETIDWLLELTSQDKKRIAVAIEKPHGAVVELFLDNDIAIFSINPKQVDRFRDRHSMSGAKGDRRDAFVLADSLRTDGHRFQRLHLPRDPRYARAAEHPQPTRQNPRGPQLADPRTPYSLLASPRLARAKEQGSRRFFLRAPTTLLRIQPQSS